MALLDDIANTLVNAGVVGGVTSWTLSLSFYPDNPDQLIGVFETGGMQPDETDGTRYDKVSFQVRVRAAAWSYDTARSKIDEVFNALNDATVTGYVYIFASQAPIPIGYDESNRPSIVLNFEAMKQRT